MAIRSGITSLDMNVLLDELGEGKRKPQEAKASWGSYREKARQKVSDSVAEKAGVREETFDFIDEERKRSYAAEKEREKELAEGFGKFFSETDDYITENQAEGKIKTTSKGYGSREAYYKNSSDEYLDRYNAGEKYLMSEGKNAFENTAKGAVNRARSVVGGTAEDIAYMINDYAPWYVPAETVLQNNTAGTIGKKADEQFSLAKDKT